MAKQTSTVRKLKTWLKNPVFTTVAGFIIFLWAAASIMHMIEISQGNAQGFDNFFHSLWYAVVTVTTVGYGDVTPRSDLGQVFAIFIIFAGIGYSGVLTGSITSWLVERNRRREMGLVPLKEASDKLLICGWKPNMREMLKSILAVTGGESSDLVLLNQMDHQEVQDLRKDPLLEDFFFYSGDDTNVDDLRKANAMTARKVLVLADHRPDKSAEEIDFQSVLTSLAVNKLSPGIYQIVELILPKFRLYITQARVEEVILNETYARNHLVNMALMSGMNNVFLALFDEREGVLGLRRFKSSDVGRTYGSLKADIPGQVVIGILENVGNLGQRKIAKLNQVQKSPKIADSIEGLMELKQMQANHPIFNPPDSYKIKEGCDLIVLNVAPHALNKLSQESVGQLKFGDVSNHKELAVSIIKKSLIKCDSWEDYFERLSRSTFEFFIEDEEMMGVSYRQERYLFEQLELGRDLPELLRFQYCRLVLQQPVKMAREITGMVSPSDFAESHGMDQFSAEFEAATEGPLMVLGWKKETIDIISSLVKHQDSPGVRWNGITVVADVEADKQAEFERHFNDKEDVKLHVGDPVLHLNLIQAGLDKAKKVLILSETGRGRSTEEVDAQTALACMVVQEINKKAYIVAEVQSSKYLDTLSGSSVEEIFSTDQFANIILANGAHARGTSNVIRDMVDTNAGVVRLIPIEDRFIGGSFGELMRDYFNPRQILMGLLEEAGNLYNRKAERIAEAKFKADITESVKQLSKVRQVSANKVVLSPPTDYLIKPHSRLIILNSNCKNLWQSSHE